MSVLDGVERDLREFPEGLRSSGLAEAARRIAVDIDDPDTRPAARSMLSKELRDTLAALKALAPPKQHHDGIDDLAKRRTSRRAASSG